MLKKRLLFIYLSIQLFYATDAAVSVYKIQSIPFEMNVDFLLFPKVTWDVKLIDII